MKCFDHISLEAEAVTRLVCKTTGKTVGVEYLWETGQTSTLWVDHQCEDIEKQPIHRKKQGKD